MSENDFLWKVEVLCIVLLDADLLVVVIGRELVVDKINEVDVFLVGVDLTSVDPE